MCEKCYDEMVNEEHNIRLARDSLNVPFRMWDFKSGNNAVLRRVLTAAFGSTKPKEGTRVRSIYVHGHTGLCKTRAICEAARRASEVGIPSKFVQAAGILSKYSATFEKSSAEAFRYAAKIASYPFVLIVDDLGVGKVTERGLEFLFLLFDRRLSEWRETWVTGNYNPKSLMSWIDKTDEEYSERIVRRLTDLCEVIDAEGEK